MEIVENYSNEMGAHPFNVRQLEKLRHEHIMEKPNSF